MSVTMTPVLEKFLNACKQAEQIVSVTAEDPDKFYMDQIGETYTLMQTPVLFRFMVTDLHGHIQPVEVILPYEILNNLDGPPVTELVNVATRHGEVPAYGMRFACPDGSGVFPLVGHKWSEVEDPHHSLEKLVALLKTVPDVENVTVHDLIDPEQIAKTGSPSNSAVRIVMSIKELSDPSFELHEKVGYHHDYNNFIISKEVYLDEESHQGLFETASKNVQIILNKGKLC